MPSNFQSIEDLLEDEKVDERHGDEATTQAKLQAKQKEMEVKKVEELTKQKAAAAGLPYIDLFGFPISTEALSLIPEEESKRLKVVCFLYVNEEIRLGTIEPREEVNKLMNELKEMHHCQGQLYLISERSFEAAVKLYKTIPKPKEYVRGVKISEQELNKYSEKFSSFKDLEEEISKVDVTQIVSMLMAAAVQSRSSDVHIEREEKDIKVRFRVDGVLHDVAFLKPEVWPKIITRLKLLAKVKINIADKPQDGRFTIFMKNPSHPSDEYGINKGGAGRKIDIRASFLPTAHGESIALRLLDSAKEELSFEDLGIVGEAFEGLKRQVERPNGMIITTGPTGSGKTTTLYSILKKLNKSETKIITIEDPIEYQIEGINQSQVTERYTFAKGLRSIVRQDPDIIMVGEIRDLETAEIAVQAALTGHLVLSTLHTNDASGAIPRLLSMGVKPFLLAPAMNAMIGQRLVRRICEKCKQEVQLTEEQKQRIEKIFELANEEANQPPGPRRAGKADPPWAGKQVSAQGGSALGGNLETAKFYKGKGCEICQSIGYKGRIGIYEIMLMNADIEKLIQAGKISEFDLKETAIKNGMVTMVQDGILKAMQGVTTVEEVLRVAE